MENGKFFKEKEYIATWIIVFLTILTLSGIIIGFYHLFGRTSIIYASTDCPIKYLDGFDNFLKQKCNELSIGQEQNLSKDLILQFIKGPQNADIESKIDREQLGICKLYTKCTYIEKLGENIKISTSLSVCVYRNATNETICY